MYRIYPYKMASKSARKLRDMLGGKLIRLRNSRYSPRDNHIVVNCGNSHTPRWWGQGNTTYLNSPECVAIASNKLLTFEELLMHVDTPDWTTDPWYADHWLSEGHTVFARTKLRSSGGDGVAVLRPGDAIIGAPLYTKMIESKGEYRVHVFNGKVILYQKKSRRYKEDGTVDAPDTSQKEVRNLDSGWVYRTGNLRRLERVEKIAVDAMRALMLNFGAVDIIMDNEGKVYVLEVNTAPGILNTQTCDAYLEEFSRLFTNQIT